MNDGRWLFGGTNWPIEEPTHMMTGGSSPGGDGASSPRKNDELSLIVADEDNIATSTTAANDEDVDPWALLAAAAGDREITNDGSIGAATASTTMTHTEGEVFTLPPYGLSSSSSSAAVDPSSSSSSATTTIPPFLASIATRLHDVDEQYLNLSTKIREFDTTHQLTDKLTQYNEDVIKPVTARTIERTSIAALNVRERASVVSARLSERVNRIAEEHKQQRSSSGSATAAAANMDNNTDNSEIADDRGKQWKEGIINIAMPAKERAFAGVGWLQQRIQETRDRQQHRQQREQRQQQQDYSTTTTTSTSTSFTRDAVEERLREREKQRRERNSIIEEGR